MKKNLRMLAILLIIALFPTAAFAQTDRVHRVAPGEALFMIAQKYGITIQELVAKNGYLRNPNAIFPRQVLIVPPASKPSVYTVQSGDSLFKISQKVNVPMATIAQLNNLSDWNQLHVGQVLSLPPSAGTSVPAAPTAPATYTVKAGDTLYKISQQLNTSMTILAQENNLTDWNQLRVGQVLKLPVAQIPQPEPTFLGTVSNMSAKYPDTFYSRSPSTTNKIALTFDDGPDGLYTSQILDVLKAHNVPSTFFLVGSKAETHAQEVHRIVAEGHVIANHTWSHPDLRKIDSVQLAAEIEQTEKALEKVTGLKTALMRPPYGAVSNEVVENLRDLNYKVINWSADSMDWRDRNVDSILINTLPDVRNGGILLFHSGPGDSAATVAALPELIETLKMQGYEFVTVDKLLNLKPYR